MSNEASQFNYDKLDRAAEETLPKEEEIQAQEDQDKTEQESEAVNEEVNEGVPVEEDPEKVEQKRQKDLENAERSKLGRKVKSLEDQIGKLTSLLEKQEEDEEEDEEIILTPKELPKYLEKIEEKKKAEHAQYEKDYTGEFAKLGADDTNFQVVWEEMVNNHNSVITGDPSIDAQMNYLKAKNTLLQRNTPENKLKGKGKEANTNINVPTKMKDKENKPIKLDPEAEEFAKRMGLSEEFIQKSLNT